ncbi:MAG: hypothetical protein LBO03_06920 [Acidaminococcales bacterium]|jgi:hypothetical protein|nr:hypothetical protein [Acidaminococcales bacterium]
MSTHYEYAFKKLELQHQHERYLKRIDLQNKRMQLLSQDLRNKEKMLFTAAMTYGKNTLKYLFFMNGCAIIALLSILTHNWPTAGNDIPHALKVLLYAVRWFSFGLISTVASLGFTYIFQSLEAANFDKETKKIWESFYKEEKYINGKTPKHMQILYFLPALCAVVALVFFILGTNCALRNLLF